jgi:hypothetical protein
MGGGLSSAIYTPAWLPIFAILFATLVGMLSGLYPALRATRLDPIHGSAVGIAGARAPASGSRAANCPPGAGAYNQSQKWRPGPRPPPLVSDSLHRCPGACTTTRSLGYAVPTVGAAAAEHDGAEAALSLARKDLSITRMGQPLLRVVLADRTGTIPRRPVPTCRAMWPTAWWWAAA